MSSFERTLKYLIYTGLVATLCTAFIVPYTTFYEVLTNQAPAGVVDAFSLFFPYITGKAFFFRIIVEVIFLLWIALAIAQKKYRPTRSPILYAIIAFLITLFVSNYFGANWTASFWSNFERMDGYLTLLHLFALYVVAASVLKSETDWKILFNISIVASIVMAYITVQQIQSHATDGQLFRADTTIGNPIYLAVYSLFHVFLSLFYMLRKKYNSPMWWVYTIAIIVNIWMLLQTGTRGALIGLLAGFGTTALLIAIYHWKNKTVRWTTIGIITMLVVIVGGLWSAKDTEFVQNNAVLKRFTSISLAEDTGAARILNWQIAIEGIKERPLFGWGQNNYNLVFDKHYLPAMHGNEAWFDRTHNIILDWAIAGGVIGLVLMLSIFGLATYLLLRKSPYLIPTDRAVLVGVLVAYFVHNLFVFDNLVSYIILFLLFAYIHTQNATEIQWPDQKPLSERARIISAVVCILVLPFTMYAINNDSYQTNIDLVDAQRVLRRDPNTNSLTYYYTEGLEKNLALFERALARDTFANPEIRQHMMLTYSDVIARINDESATATKEQFVNAIIAELEQQIMETPTDSRFPYLLGVFYVRLGDMGNAEKWLQQAIALSPRKQTIRVPLIRAYLQSGQNEKALALAKETYELDTSKDDMWIEYAKTVYVNDTDAFKQLVEEAINNNDADKAIALFIYNLERKPDDIQNHISLAVLYYRTGDATSSVAVLRNAVEKFPQYKYQLEPMVQGVLSGSI